MEHRPPTKADRSRRVRLVSRLDPEIARAARVAAAERGIHTCDVVNDALRAHLQLEARTAA